MILTQVSCRDLGNDNSSTSYLIGKHIVASFSPTGRGTKGYVAFNLKNARLCFLKDYWRPSSAQIRSELEIYKRLHDNNVRRIATALGGGDVLDPDQPDLPADRFSEAARDFVAGCLNKIPKLRATYPMLLQHAWLAPLLKPDVITEEDEEAAEKAHAAGESIPQPDMPGDGEFYDREVGEWVIAALEKRREGKMAKNLKPALHAVALDAVSPHDAPKAPTAAGPTRVLRSQAKGKVPALSAEISCGTSSKAGGPRVRVLPRKTARVTKKTRTQPQSRSGRS